MLDTHSPTTLIATMAARARDAARWLARSTDAQKAAALVAAADAIRAAAPAIIAANAADLARASANGLSGALLDRLRLDGPRIAAIPEVVEVHDLHVWQITSGQLSLSAHILVGGGVDCHAARSEIETVLHTEYRLDHTTLQVDHAGRDNSGGQGHDEHCVESHGPVHRSATERH